MPHKHKRKRGKDDEADFNLPPTQKARPLPVISKKGSAAPKKGGAAPQKGGAASKAPVEEIRPSRKRKSKGGDKADDAPRAFKRLMAMAQGKRTRSGLDDGNEGKTAAKNANAEIPKIQPGEDLRSYAVRVDAALPVSGLTKKTVIKDGKDEAGQKIYRTKKERKMHKLYDQWHAEERKIQSQREDELELEAEKILDKDNITSASLAKFDEEPPTKKKGRRKRAEVEEDPWLALKKKRAETRVGLHDTAQAPPELHKKITRQLKVDGAAVNVDGVPKSAGSLRRREELQVVRNDVVEAYRKIREHEQAKLRKS